jgi:hypothetical protein
LASLTNHDDKSSSGNGLGRTGQSWFGRSGFEFSFISEYIDYSLCTRAGQGGTLYECTIREHCLVTLYASAGWNWV